MAERIRATSECPDGGFCRHQCAGGCFRVRAAGPLTGHYPCDIWPPSVVRAETAKDIAEAIMVKRDERADTIDLDDPDCGVTADHEDGMEFAFNISARIARKHAGGTSQWHHVSGNGRDE